MGISLLGYEPWESDVKAEGTLGGYLSQRLTHQALPIKDPGHRSHSPAWSSPKTNPSASYRLWAPHPFPTDSLSFTWPRINFCCLHPQTDMGWGKIEDSKSGTKGPQIWLITLPFLAALEGGGGYGRVVPHFPALHADAGRPGAHLQKNSNSTRNSTSREVVGMAFALWVLWGGFQQETFIVAELTPAPWKK